MGFRGSFWRGEERRGQGTYGEDGEESCTEMFSDALAVEVL